MESASVNPIISPGKDARQFRRFTARRDAGVRPLGVNVSRETVASSEPGAGICYHSATVQDLSMMGLYFVSSLPYRVGLRLEAQFPLPSGLVTVTGLVHRVEVLTRAGGGGAVYGCGVHFVQSQMGTVVRRALMLFLLQLAPSELCALPRPRAGLL